MIIRYDKEILPKEQKSQHRTNSGTLGGGKNEKWCIWPDAHMSFEQLWNMIIITHASRIIPKGLEHITSQHHITPTSP